MLRFTLFGFPVTIHWMFWVVSVMLSGTAFSSHPLAFKLTLVWVLVVFISILWHELGHAFAFRHYGQKSVIMLYGLGGYARGAAPLTRKQDIVISLAGPAAGFLLGLVVWLVERAYPVIYIDKPMMMHFFRSMWWVNIIWSAVNLLPVLPLDGGRVCAAVVADRKPGLAPKIGVVTAIGMVLVALKFDQIYVAVMFGFLAYQNWGMIQNIHGRPGTGGRGFGGGAGTRGA